MRIGLLADIHGNREAFDACLNHALRLGALGVTASRVQRVPVETPQPPGYSAGDLRVLTGWDWPTANAA